MTKKIFFLSLFLWAAEVFAQITVPPPRTPRPVATTREELVQRDQVTYFAGCNATPPGSVLNGTDNTGTGGAVGGSGERRSSQPAGGQR